MTRKVALDQLIDDLPLTGLQLRVVACCALVALLDGLDTMSIGIAAPAMARQFHWAPRLLAPVFSLGLVGGMAGALAMGPIGDRFGRKWPMVVSALLMAIGTIGSAFASGLPDLIAWRILAGLGLGAANPSFIALTAEYAPARLRGTLVALMWAAFPLGGVVGGLVNPALIAAGGWRLMFEVGGVASLVVAALVALFCPESLRFLALRAGSADRIRGILRRMGAADAAGAETFGLAEPPQPSASVAQLFSPTLARRTLLLWVVYAINFACLGFIPLWGPTLLTRPGGLSLAQSSLVVGAWSLGSVMGAGGIGRLFDLFSPPRVMAALYVLAGGCVAALALSGGAGAFAPAFAAALAGNFCFGAASSGALILAAAIYPTALRSSGVGWAMGLGRAGQVAGSALAGVLLSASWTPTQIFLALGASAGLAAIASVALSGREARQRRALAEEPVSLS